jgi:hypothetical protein
MTNDELKYNSMTRDEQMHFVMERNTRIKDISKQILWHYTNWKTLEGVIGTGDSPASIWASDARYLNDTEELIAGVNVLLDLVHKLDLEERIREGIVTELRRKALALRCYVVSLSSQFDSLSQWRAYGQCGVGIAIGFSRTHIESIGKQHGFDLHRCIYGRKGSKEWANPDESFLETLKDHNRRMSDETIDPRARGGMMRSLGHLIHSMTPGLADSALRFKHDSFTDEDESRLISKANNAQRHAELPVKFHVKGTLAVPHLEIPLTTAPFRQSPCENEGHSEVDFNHPMRAILVGPSAHPELNRDSIKALLDREKMLNVPVCCSIVPYRNW